jgi:hypothetical protein
MATVVSGMVVHYLLLLFAFRGKEEPNSIALVEGFSTFLMWLGFIVGVVSLGIIPSVGYLPGALDRTVSSVPAGS